MIKRNRIEFNPAQVQGYRLIGYENRLLNAEDFNDDKKDAGELGAGHTVTALYEIIPTGVKSDFLASVDDLKYQEVKTTPTANNSKELLTVKLRYKEPDAATSKRLDLPVFEGTSTLVKSSDNFRFAAAVAEFGLLLRSSEYKGKASYTQAIELAKGAKGKDVNGYRMELIKMMETRELLD